MINERVFLQFYGYLWFLIFFVLLLPAVLIFIGGGVDYLVFLHWLGLSFKVDPIIAQTLDLIAVVVAVIGLGIIVEAALTLLRNGDTFPFSVSLHKHSRPSKLVQSGVYRQVRHPMLLGYLMVLEGLGILLRSPSMVLWLVPLVGAVLLEYLLLTEEKNLERWFGPEYKVYQKKTSLLIPRVL